MEPGGQIDQGATALQPGRHREGMAGIGIGKGSGIQSQQEGCPIVDRLGGRRHTQHRCPVDRLNREGEGVRHRQSAVIGCRHPNAQGAHIRGTRGTTEQTCGTVEGQPVGQGRTGRHVDRTQGERGIIGILVGKKSGRQGKAEGLPLVNGRLTQALQKGLQGGHTAAAGGGMVECGGGEDKGIGDRQCPPIRRRHRDIEDPGRRGGAAEESGAGIKFQPGGECTPPLQGRRVGEMIPRIRIGKGSGGDLKIELSAHNGTLVRWNQGRIENRRMVDMINDQIEGVRDRGIGRIGRGYLDAQCPRCPRTGGATQGVGRRVEHQPGGQRSARQGTGRQGQRIIVLVGKQPRWQLIGEGGAIVRGMGGCHIHRTDDRWRVVDCPNREIKRADGGETIGRIPRRDLQMQHATRGGRTGEGGRLWVEGQPAWQGGGAIGQGGRQGQPVARIDGKGVRIQFEPEFPPLSENRLTQLIGDGIDQCRRMGKRVHIQTETVKGLCPGLIRGRYLDRELTHIRPRGRATEGARGRIKMEP